MIVLKYLYSGTVYEEGFFNVNYYKENINDERSRRLA